MSEEVPVFYHGTRTPFTRGGYLMPRTFHKAERGQTSAPLKPGRKPREDSERYVYITTDRIVAWVYAWCAPGRGRPRVLTVEPCSDVWSDPEHSADMEAYRCEFAKVVAVDMTPLVTEIEARTGWIP